MKVKVFADVHEEKVVRLTLRDENGIVYVVAVDENGEAISYLLSISQEGITRCDSVKEKLGFPLLAFDGRIKMAELVNWRKQKNFWKVRRKRIQRVE